MNRRLLLFVSSLLLLLPSCATWPRIIGTSIAGGSDGRRTINVKGIRQAVSEAARGGGSVHLFLVHGMSNHPFGKETDFPRKFQANDYADILKKLRSKDFREQPARHNSFVESIAECQFNPLVPRLAERLKLAEKTDENQLEWYLDGEGVLGYKLRRVFVSAPTDDFPSRRLVVHLCAWAPVSISEKIKLRNNDDYIQRDTFIVNKLIKDGVITWGLADAAQYVGKSKGRIQLAVARGIESMAREASLETASGRRKSPDKFAFGAASLGSIVTLDTLRSLADTNGDNCYLGAGGSGCISVSSDAVQAMFSGNMPLYLFANQIPLLGPADPSNRDSGSIESKVASFARDIGTKNLTVVAFNDPSDFLGYRVPQINSNGKTSVDVVNVMTRNQSIGIWYVVNNPLDAHTGFPKTRAVMNFIADGRTISSTGDTGILSWFSPTSGPQETPVASGDSMTTLPVVTSDRDMLRQSSPVVGTSRQTPQTSR